jgi:hypothetical protein
MSDYALPAIIVLLVLLVIVVARSALRQHPRILSALLTKLVETLVALALNVPAVFVCFGICDSLGLLPMAPGDGAIGDALCYLGVGYLLALVGLVLCHAYMLLAFLVGHSRSITKAVIIVSCAVFVGILVLLMVLGHKWQNGLLSVVFYGFLVIDSGFWTMFFAAAIGRFVVRLLSHQCKATHSP